MNAHKKAVMDGAGAIAITVYLGGLKGCRYITETISYPYVKNIVNF